MSIADLVEEIVGGLTSGLIDFGTGFASGIKSFVSNLLFDTSGSTTTTSSFTKVLVVGGSVALSVGATTLIFHFIQHLI